MKAIRHVHKTHLHAPYKSKRQADDGKTLTLASIEAIQSR